MKRAMFSLAALVLCAPLVAQAAEGWVIDDISLQAGPDPAYPSVMELAAGTPVSIQGCIDGWTWCDVIAGAERGWVPGTFLEEDYGGQRVVLIDYGPRIGIPIVGFSLNLYWDQHYHNRPFYTQREQWVAKAIKPSPPPRPATSVARTNTQQRAGTTATATTSAQATTSQTKMQQQSKMTASQQTVQQQSRTTASPQTMQQPKTAMPQQKVATRTTAPKRPETTPPEAGKQPSQAEKKDSAHESSTLAKAKPRAGEPQPKDELKKPKSKDDKHEQDGGGQH